MKRGVLGRSSLIDHYSGDTWVGRRTDSRYQSAFATVTPNPILNRIKPNTYFLLTLNEGCELAATWAQGIFLFQDSG